MKKLIVLLWLLLPFVTFSQEMPVNQETGKVEYKAIVDVKETKNELFSRAKNWVLRTFSSAEEMIQQEDQDQGILVIKGLSLIDYTALNSDSSIEVPMHFSLTIEVQDNHYQYRFTDIYFKADTTDSSLNIPMEETLLGKAEKRIILSEHIQSSGLDLTTEQFQEELKAAYLRYEQFQSKGDGTLIGISNLLKEGMLVSTD